MKECQVRVSFWAVNGSQSEILVIRKFKIDCQGFVIGYDIEITMPIYYILQLGHVLQGRQHLLSSQLNGHFG